MVLDNIKKMSGFDYTCEFFNNKCQSAIILWLGIRPFSEIELKLLIDEFSAKEVITALNQLKLAGIIDPVPNKEDKWNLSESGYDLHELLMNIAVWGRHQMNDQEDKENDLIVEPDKDASMSELLRFRDEFTKEYLDI